MNMPKSKVQIFFLTEMNKQLVAKFNFAGNFPSQVQPVKELKRYWEGGNKIILCKAKGINYICGNERCRDGYYVFLQ
jgi:hypothetical protein